MTYQAVDLDEGIGRRELHRIRDRFLRLANTRLRRMKTSMLPVQKDFVDLLPLLFHANHPMLPGYVSSDTPAGLADYQPGRDTLLAIKKYARSYTHKKRAFRSFSILGLYLMGSIGSLGQEPDSDLDIWLCHRGNLKQAELDALQEKANRIERWGHEHGLEVHFFLMHAESFRDGVITTLSNDSAGGTQQHILLEEFYRTNLYLAGLPIMWWLVPLEHEDHYTDFTRMLIKKRFISEGDWLDFGGFEQVLPEEFFGAGRWQLHKGIDTPYKSLLKIMLVESYTTEYPNTDWLCRTIKEAVYSGEKLDMNRLDPYGLVMDRVTHYLTERGEHERLDLARRSFYFKAGQSLSRSHSNGWQQQQLFQLTEEWGWSKANLLLLDGRLSWKLDRVIEERNALVSELSRSYRILSDFAHDQANTGDLEAMELSLLGRKLYAALERRPGKVEHLNLAISRDLSEHELWLWRDNNATDSSWHLYRDEPVPSDTYSEPMNVATTLIELLAWIRINGLTDKSTHIHIRPHTQARGTPEHMSLLKVMNKHLTEKMLTKVPLHAYADSPATHCSIAFINVGRDPFTKLSNAGMQLTTEWIDPLSYGAANHCLVETVDHLMVTTWGEVLVHHHGNGMAGVLDMICQHLNMNWSLQGNHLVPLDAFAFSSPKADAIANRLSQLHTSIWEGFRKIGEQGRYILRASDKFYCIEKNAKGFYWRKIGVLAALFEMLAEVPDQFRPLYLDPFALPHSHLPLILSQHKADSVQIFYALERDKIDFYVLDDSGALFHQQLAKTEETYFLLQQRRFFDSLRTRRLLTSTLNARRLLAEETLFYRLELDDGGWRSRKIRPPESAPGDYMELMLIAGPNGPEEDRFSLVSGSREFSSIALGKRFYQEVVEHLLKQRQGKGDYPIYLTGIITAGLEQGSQWPIIDMLRFRHTLERRLNRVRQGESAE